MTRLRIPLFLAGIGAPPQAGTPLRLGVPLPRGLLHAPPELALVDADGRRVPWQGQVLERWIDRSVRWLLVDAVVPADGCAELALVAAEAAGPPAVELPALQVDADDGRIALRCGGDLALLPASGGSNGRLLERLAAAGTDLLDADGLTLQLCAAAGSAQPAVVARSEVVAAGPLRAELLTAGRFAGDCPLEFRARWSFFAGRREASCELMLRNPRRARHVGGLWDLGDAGSWRIGDCSLRLRPAFAVEAIEWAAQPQQVPCRQAPAPLRIYQDSSGGEHWDSPNHVEADGRPGVRFRGYRVHTGDGRLLEEGLRAQPWLQALGAEGLLAVGVDEFWQNFPKALRWDGGALEVGLFPRERGLPVELQGGEQKRHLLRLRYGTPAAPAPAAAGAQVHAWVDPAWVEASAAVPGFIADLGGCDAHREYVQRIVDGPDSFESRRERIDEYGWRHFGDLYADHEAVRAPDAAPFVSHYNNQYDFVLGAAVQALASGDPRWLRLAAQAARHCVDIDIYHSDEDRPAFNGGLFWHTDHYLPAATATHRTYSRANARGRDYGGGPGNEHNYASGLLLHHLMTGDADSREAVIGLADWVIAMDDGARTPLGLLDPAPTGAASRTVDDGFHGPGRGAGNSIGTLLDAYRLTRHRPYVTKAEELIRRCIHPADDLAARRLDDPERRWSYLVFLQALGKYLGFKRELDEADHAFHYARASLLHYAAWMLEHEVPYRDVLHKVEFPTETWPAQDIRKCHVLHLAAAWSGGDDAQRYRARAAFFYERCLADLQAFETRHLTRPLVLLCVHGHLHAHYMRKPLADAATDPWLRQRDYDYGEPQRFVAQRARAFAAFRERARVALREALRLAGERLARLRRSPAP